VQIKDLEEQNLALEEANKTLEASVAKLKTHNEQQAKEIDGLRSRANISQQNWVKERDELISREALAREECESAKQAMQDWEVLAMEERSIRENLGEKVTELEHQLATMKEAHDRAASERDSQSQTVDGLQRALREIQDGKMV
jgi:chromosome segregation ATPase